MKPLKNATLKKRVLATMVSATVAFGGVAVAAPSADADQRITSQYSALDSADQHVALAYNATQKVNRAMEMMDTVYGPGWCIDRHLDVPFDDTQYDVRKLDGTSGFYGFNYDYGGDLKIHPDIQKAAINLTKSMLDSYYAGQEADAKRKNFALQALLSNNLEMLDQLRGHIYGAFTLGNSNGSAPKVTQQEFLQWTGFQIGQNYGKPLGQSAFYLVKNEQAFSQLKVKAGEYVTVLVPKNYNVYADLNKERTNQRIVIVAQPGLEGYEPHKTVIRETVTVTPPAQTVTETAKGSTVTVTERVRATAFTEVEERPTITKTERVQPVKTITETASQPDKTVTAWAQPEMSGVTETYTREPVTETVTETASTPTVTKYLDEPVVVTKTETITPTATEDAPQKTNTVTQTADPVYVTETTTEPEKTETTTVTAAPKTVVSTVHTTVTNVEKIERTTEVERYYRQYKYAFDFRNSDKSQQLEVGGLGDWKIDFIDDSNGLVKVEKKLVDGKYVLEVTPVKEGTGTVRIVVVDSEGNRNEYTINVVNEKAKQVEITEAVQNNHYFNVGVGSYSQTIHVPKGWNYEIVEGGNFADTEAVEGGFRLKVKDNVLRGTVKVKVFEEVDGKKTGNETNYIFNIDAMGDRFNQTRTIGNANSYKLEVANVEEQPKIVSGEDLIESIVKGEDGFWVITPKSGAEGDAVIEATDKDGNVYTYTLKIKQGTNVLVDVETHTINEGESVKITAEGDDFELEAVDGQAGYNPDNWEIQGNGREWTIVNKENGAATFNLYKKDANSEEGRILVGVYTVIAKPKAAPTFKPAEIERTIFDRNTLDITPGKVGDTPNKVEVTKGGENVTVVMEDGKYRVLPKPGFEGDIVLTESAQGQTVATYTIHVVPGEVEKTEKTAKSDSIVTFTGVKDGQELRITQGEHLVDTANSNLQQGQIKFVPGASGKVVIENLNSRGLPFQTFTFEVSPVDPVESTIELNGNSAARIGLPSGLTYEIDGPDLVDIERDGNELVITPKDDAKGTTTVLVKDERGNVLYRYILNVDGTNKPAKNSTVKETYTISTDGSYKVVRRNDNPLKVTEGSEWVNIDERDGQWIVTPKGPESVGKEVVIVEQRGDVIVRRDVVKIVPEATPLRYTEERGTLVNELTGRIIKGDPKNEIRYIRGKDLVTEKTLPNGTIQLTPVKDKVGNILIEEVDSEGNPVRIIELEVPKNPDFAEGNTLPEIKWTGNNKDGWTVNVTGGSNSVDIKLCEDGDPAKGTCTKLVPLDPNNVVPGKGTAEGSELKIKPGDYLNGYKYIVLDGTHNGMGTDVRVMIDVAAGADLSTTQPEKGSSELDGKCIASLVGLSAPLLLAIPLGILSQVQIPGLEGLSAQVNNAIREANDQIQRGLGIYDNDRAQRAADLQGAFSVENPEMLGLAAGSLAAITLGLLIVDGVMRACGQEEMTSSYKIGEAMDSEFLMHGSSGKSAESTKKESASSSKDTAASAEK